MNTVCYQIGMETNKGIDKQSIIFRYSQKEQNQKEPD